jgi:D-alanine-D-alanine ligase
LTLAVAVVAGGPSTEANVSRTSARAVSAALAQVGHRVQVLELEPELAPRLLAGGYDVVFPVTHGPMGEDGCLQGLLEVLGLPYVGPAVLASALAASKPHAKVFFRRAGLPVAEHELVARGESSREAAARARAKLGRAVVVKPASGGSAIATTRIAADASDDELVRGLEAALALDPFALVERFVSGLEVTCGVLDDELGTRALPPTLIHSKAAPWYDFESRYAPGGSTHECPAPFSRAVTERVQEIALGAFRALGCRDLSRVDFVVGDASDAASVILLEVNTLPGMTATSLYPEAAAAAGISFPELCDRLARHAHARPGRVRPPEMPMPGASDG